ncbi:MAG: hypothetical protein WDZ31_03735 [Phycisphaeraceae bacterium]
MSNQPRPVNLSPQSSTASQKTGPRVSLIHGVIVTLIAVLLLLTPQVADIEPRGALIDYICGALLLLLGLSLIALGLRPRRGNRQEGTPPAR